MNKFKMRGNLYNDWKVFMVKQKNLEDLPLAINVLQGRYSPKNSLFMDISLTGEDATEIMNRTKKGDEIEAMGVLRPRRFEDKATGKKRVSITFRVKVWQKVTEDVKWDPDSDLPFTTD